MSQTTHGVATLLSQLSAFAPSAHNRIEGMFFPGTEVCMATVYEVVMRGYSPTNEFVDETVGIFERKEQAEKLVEGISDMWPEERDGLVASVVEHELGVIERKDMAFALAERMCDTLIAGAESSDPLPNDVMDAVLGSHSLDGPLADEFREAYKPFFDAA